jgi:7-cyano-7-deazaguanine synthase in queuosine biosynthesis
MGTEYYINDETIADSFGRKLAPLLSDWIDIALACYLADRLSRRPHPKGSSLEQWSRVLTLKISVRRLDVWKQPNVQRRLVSLLNLLSDDDWRIQFVRRKTPGRRAEKQGHLFRTSFSKPLSVALFSGGLDSFCGAVQQVSDFSNHSFVFVSGVTNSRQRFAQREQVKAISRHMTRELCHVIVPFGFNWNGLSLARSKENSQRTRGFLFLTLGAVTALAAGSNEIRIFENGIGAINLPYDSSQIGTANSRGVHPITLLRMTDFVKALTGKSISFTNPFLFKTKGEMCRHHAVQALASNIPRTFSCDGFPVRHRNKPQCGSCTSCLLRRLSLEYAGLSDSDPSDQYILDLLVPGGAAATSKQLRPLQAMEWQFQKLYRLLGPGSQWSRLVTEFPELQHIVSEISIHDEIAETELQQSILGLYRRYAVEWANFSARNSLRVQQRAA